MNPIISVKINGVTYPYIQNTNGFEYTQICYDDGGTTKKTNINNVEEFIMSI